MSDKRCSNHRDTRSWCVDSRAQQCLTSFSHPPVLSLAFTACASCDARRRCCWLYMYRAQHPQQLHLPHMTKRGDAAEKGQKQEWAFAEFSGLSCALHGARVLAVHASRLQRVASILQGKRHSSWRVCSRCFKVMGRDRERFSKAPMCRVWVRYANLS